MSQPVPVAALVLVRPVPDGLEVACVHRAGGRRFDADLWTFPGGRWGSASDAPMAAARWAAEHLSVDLDPAHLRPCGRWLELPFRPQRRGTHLVLAQAGGVLRLDHPDLDDAAWIQPEALLERWRRDEASLEPGTQRVLQALADLGSPTADGWPDRAAEALTGSLPSDGELQTLELQPALRVVPVRTPTLPPATHTNCVVVGHHEAVVIDPASPYDDELARLDALLDALQAQGTRVREILLTHHHPDHVGGARHLAQRLGVPVAAHRTTRELLKGRVDVTREVVDGETIELPGQPARRLRAIVCEGHADGHLAFLEETTHTLIAGDMVAGTGTILIAPPEGKLGLYLRSLQALADLESRRLIPSHGPAIGDPRGLLEQYVTHRGWRERKVTAALAQAGAAPVEALVPLVYDDVPPAVYPLAARSLLAHLLKLEEEGLATRSDEVWRGC
jgi:glyoxylase-like metal-dependent hydrolase (beta-lactamase superfamily II)/8-oxo-dGTP pyrophosphatase MutT (NUDIX family)